jgi:hypothetical protein
VIIKPFLPTVDELVTEGLVILEAVPSSTALTGTV